MFLKDYTIPEVEAMYQKEIIRGAWRLLALLVLCVFIYLVVRQIVRNRIDARHHDQILARIKESCEIGKTGFWAARASQTSTILEQKKRIQGLLRIVYNQEEHIERLEQTMKDLHFGDVADRIRKEIEDGKNESENRR